MEKRPRRRTADVTLHRARELRRSMTAAERRLWQELRNNQLGGAHFRRQHPVGPFVVDFFCADARLVIEVDGDSHSFRPGYDAARTRWLAEQKEYQVLRFTNEEVASEMEGVLWRIAQALRGPSSDAPVRRSTQRAPS